jgi:hypothetical protein
MNLNNPFSIVTMTSSIQMMYYGTIRNNQYSTSPDLLMDSLQSIDHAYQEMVAATNEPDAFKIYHRKIPGCM